MRIGPLAVSLLLLLVALAPAQDGLDAKARIRQAWRPLPEITGDAFRFLVMADNQPHGNPERIAQTEEFGRLVRSANLLDPDLVLFAGDLILGYDRDPAVVHAMWDAFDAAAKHLDAPFRMTPGNHCIWDARSQAIWKERYGPRYHAFTVGRCRFLALDTEESFGTTDHISDEQLAWIEREVAAAKDARHLFVFLHKPLWRFEPGREPWMERVHPILKRHPSTTVLAGHFHRFERSKDRDGVRYYVAPAAGGPVGKVEAAADFHGLLHVSVRGEKVVVSCVRDGAVLPDSFLGEDRAQAFYEMTQKVDVGALIVSPDGKARPTEARVAVANHLGETIRVEATVTFPVGCRWRVELGEPTFTVAAGETDFATARLACEGSPFPAPVVRLIAKDGDTVVLDQERTWPVTYDRKLEVLRTEAAPEIDGVLDEAAWAKAPGAGPFLLLSGDALAKRATVWRALWDETNLYMSFAMAEPDVAGLVAAMTARDWMQVQDDAVVFYLDVVRDGVSRFCFGVNAGGVPMEYRAPGGKVDIPWSGPWSYAVAKGEKSWAVEVAIPWTSLGFEPAAGKTFAVGAFRNANPGEREFTTWTKLVERLSNPKGFGEAILR